MQIALVADLHGNRPAVEALERDLKKVQPDKIICLGDVVGKGPSSVFTYEWAMANCDLILGGNWDYGVSDRIFPKDVYYWKQLGEKRLEVLSRLPREHELIVSGQRIRLFHGRPVMEKLIYATDDASLIQPFFVHPDGGRYDAVCYADAHTQALRNMEPGFFVNVGSVGNSIGLTKCCYAVLTGEEGFTPAPLQITLRQLDYDREQAIRDAVNQPDLPRVECYIREIETGIYSR